MNEKFSKAIGFVRKKNPANEESNNSRKISIREREEISQNK